MTAALTSASAVLADATQIDRSRHVHGTSENWVPSVRDVTSHEDAGQAYVGHALQVLVALRNAALNRLRAASWTTMAAAVRHVAASVDRAFTLLYRPAPIPHRRL